jgi:CBS domain-containing protein
MGDSSVRVEDAGDLRVRQAMIGRPKTVSRYASVGEARILFENSKNRLLLVDDDGIYSGHLMREDVPESEPDEAPILLHIRRDCPQIGPDDNVADALASASERFDNRLVVVGEDGRLEGLLCLNKRDGYLCVDVRG